MLIAVMLGAAAYAAPIEGTYWNPDHTRQVEVVIDQGVLSGTVVWVKTSAQHAQLGSVVIRAFRLDGDRWRGGEVVSPVDGRVYSGAIWLDGTDLMMRGYVGLPVFGRTARMERVVSQP